MKKNYDIIFNYLDLLFPDPKCELNYFNDYSLLISIVLSAQTLDSRVNKVTDVLFKKYKSLEELSNANINDLESILKSIGSFRKKATFVKEIATILHNKYNDIVPKDENILLTFPGVGIKTCNVFLAEYYHIPKIAVDTHVERVSKRLNFAKENDSVIDVMNKLMKIIDKDLWCKRHLQLVLFGRYHCKSINPNCINCKLKDICKNNNKD